MPFSLSFNVLFYVSITIIFIERRKTIFIDQSSYSKQSHNSKISKKKDKKC